MDHLTNADTTEASEPVQERPSDVNLVCKMVVIIVLGCFILSGNTLTIYTVIRTKKRRQIPTNIYVICLAVADAMVGFFIICIEILEAISTEEETIRMSVCWARAQYYSTIAVSTCTLLVIAIDRYRAIVHPLTYKKTNTTRRALIASVCIWLAQLAIIGGTSCYYGTVAPIGRLLAGGFNNLLPTPVYFGIIIPEICLPLFFNILIYTAIFISIHSRNKVSDNADNNKKPDKMATSVTKMMMLILGYLLFAWLPYFCIAPMYKYDQIKPMWYIYLSHAAVTLVYTNSAVNPIIYSWMNRDFRKAYKVILTCQRETFARETSNKTANTEVDNKTVV